MQVHELNTAALGQICFKNCGGQTIRSINMTIYEPEQATYYLPSAAAGARLFLFRREVS
jgi:hypothetical protein